MGDFMGFPGGASGNESTCQCRRHKRPGFTPQVGKTPWRRARHHSSVLAWRTAWTQEPGYSPGGRKESDTTEATEMGGFVYISTLLLETEIIIFFFYFNE